ncbi:hypothetical protein HME9304_00946 [Flagellimonas maritima]|uniref:Uncharacterized protein n=1 Tax=Flagellimonas maritima TaxID=1383885 RepID=A0A2Z4LRI3_9FLAO|nr:hypothetical protein [Allomuricauda aurantiaca]AWX43948.1 hypothetical protein HME9304_00946 [Allomuricauda aurantiaca]
MDIESIKKNYKNFSTEELIKLVSEIKSIKPEFIPILQNELINRNENNVAVGITEYLTSIKYHITDNILFDNILSYRKSGMKEIEIDKTLKENHGIDSEYMQLIRVSLKEKGKENIAIGIVMIILPLIFGIVLLTMRAFIGVFPLLLIGIGIWRLNKGIQQKNENK